MSDAGGDTTPTPAPVLIVDDNAGKRLALKAVLAPLELHIVEADSGIAALRCVTSQDFAVILLDVRMPIMDGVETAALIRSRQQSEMTPIIFVTAHEDNEIAHTNGYAQGAVDFISAPVVPEVLRTKVLVFTNLFMKVKELARQTRDVQKSADRLRFLTDAAPIGIFQTDVHNRYLHTNPRWSEITGMAPDDAVGQPWDVIVAADQRAALDSELTGAARYQSETCIRLEISGPDAAPRMVLVTSKSITDEAGGSTGWVGTLSDITAEVGFESAMAEARDEATEASRLKSDFLANMSHEIRTPMNGVIGMTDLLLETELDDHQRDYAQTVRNSGEALLAIINDILDFSKVEAGKLDIEDVDFDVRQIVTDVVDLLAGPAQTKGLELVAIVEPFVPPVVGGDPGRVRQILTNLVGNAVKFTHTGEVVVRVSAADVVGVTALLRFEVSDTGDGIASDKLDLVFQPFVQADTSTTRKYGGTGLGLAISGDLVALMGGHSGVSSELGVGSTFWFTIHVRTGGAPPDLDVAPADDLAHTRILIVDDNAAQRDVLVGLVTGWGMTAATAGSGQAALETLRSAVTGGDPFSVVLIDRYMPGMDGLVLIDTIHIDPVLTANLVLLTDLVHGDPGSAVVPGISASLSKPVHRDDLRRCLRVALGLAVADIAPSRAPRPSSRRPAPPPVPSGTASTAGESDLGLLLLAEDNLINQKVAVAMLSNAGYRVDTVLNGLEAVNAVAARTYDAVLMDCQMPELNGYEATAAIRALESSGRRTPIIAMTAGARSEDRQRCLAEGMDSYLAKPVSKDALLALVARSVKSGVVMDVTPPRAGEDRSGEGAIDQTVFDELRLLGEAIEHDFIAKLVDEFVNDTERLLAELRQAMVVGDALTAARIAHSIKGSCVQLGGRRLALSCSHLEERATTGSLGDGQADLQEVESDYLELCRALTHQTTSLDHQHSGGPRG
jgi:PAS domain S-box-containing protein